MLDKVEEALEHMRGDELVNTDHIDAILKLVRAYPGALKEAIGLLERWRSHVLEEDFHKDMADTDAFLERMKRDE